MANPIADGFQTYSALQGMDIQRQQLDMQQQQMANQQGALQFEHARQTAEDARTVETHQAQQAAIQKVNDRDTTQSLGYAVTNAQGAGQTEIPYDSWTPAQQKVAEDNGYVNTRVQADGSQVQTIDTSKIDVNGAQQISPIFRDKTPDEVAQITQHLGVVRSHLDTITADMKASPQKYANGAVITKEQYPGLFEALNGAIAPQVNKGLDADIAKKEVNTAVINPDGTVSLQVESFDSDGGSLGNAPITYGRGNGDPTSVVMKIPATALYDYIEVNEQLGQQIKAKQIELGDDAPLKEQTAALKSKRLADALTPEMMGSDSALDPAARSRLALIKAGVSGGVDAPVMIQAAKLIHPDRIPKNYVGNKNVMKGGKRGTAPMDATTGETDMSKWVETSEPVDPGVARENAARNRERERQDAEDKKSDKATIDKASEKLTKLSAELKGLSSADDIVAKHKEIQAATKDYQTNAVAYKANWGRPYDPIAGTVEETATAAKGSVRAELQKPAVGFLKRGGSADELRKKNWDEDSIRAASAKAGVAYVAPRAAPAPALTSPRPASVPPTQPALTRQPVKSDFQIVRVK